MTLHATIARVTDRIRERSAQSRTAYLAKIARQAEEGPRRAHLSCGNQAHAYAAMPDKDDMAGTRKPNIGVVTAYNDMLSAHQPYERYPDLIRRAAHRAGATAQVAGGVPAMCDGVTQGRAGMELGLLGWVLGCAAAFAVGAEQEVRAAPIAHLLRQVQDDAGLVAVGDAGLVDEGPGGGRQGRDHEEARSKNRFLHFVHAVR